MIKDEVCPKCRSQDVGVWSFNSETVDYECSRCRYKWIAPRASSGGKLYSHHEVTRCKEGKRKKFDASSLEEFCRKFKDYKDRRVQVWPYIPRDVGEASIDFGLIVESGHVKYEVGLSGLLLVDENSLLRRWARPPRPLVLDFGSIKRKIGMFDNFAKGLSRYLTEKGCCAVAIGIQHLGRAPERAMGDEDPEKVIHIMREYC